MEPGWAAGELLDLVEQNLNPNRTMQRAAQAMLDAIRVLPGPVAGDLLVTCAARGDISVILFYFDQGRRKVRRDVRNAPIKCTGMAKARGCKNIPKMPGISKRHWMLVGETPVRFCKHDVCFNAQQSTSKHR